MTNNVSLNVLKTTSILFFCCVVLFSNFLFAQEKKSSKKEISPSLVSTDADSPAKMDRRTIEERVLSADPSNNNSSDDKVNTKVVFAVPNYMIAKILNNYEFDANVFSVVNTGFSIFVYDTLKVSPEKRKAIFSVKKILENTPIEFSELASNYLPPIIVSNTWSQEEIRKSTQTQIINFFKKYPALFFLIDEKTKAFLESEQGLDKIIGIKESNETIIKY